MDWLLYDWFESGKYLEVFRPVFEKLGAIGVEDATNIVFFTFVVISLAAAYVLLDMAEHVVRRVIRWSRQKADKAA